MGEAGENGRVGGFGPLFASGWLTKSSKGVTTMPLGTILLIVLIVLLILSVPTWPYSRGWGYAPGGVVGLILIIVLILVLMGRI